MQALDEPEGAEVECRLRNPEVIGQVVTQEAGAASQALLERFQCFAMAGIVRLEEAQVDQLGEARIELGPAESGREPLIFLIPSLGFDVSADDGRALIPESGPIGQETEAGRRWC